MIELENYPEAVEQPLAVAFLNQKLFRVQSWELPSGETADEFFGALVPLLSDDPLVSSILKKERSVLILWRPDEASPDGR